MSGFESVVLLAMAREGCVSEGLSARRLWRVVYRQFREDARATGVVRAQLVAFRGFPGPQKVVEIPLSSIIEPASWKD